MSGGISSRGGVSSDSPNLTTANQLSAYAAGTAYSLTNTSAALTFGTTQPAITISGAGTYLILARTDTRFNGATFAASRTITMKLRRTNNTAADITGGTDTGITGIVTTITGEADGFIMWALYTTTNNNDIITIFGDVSVVPSAGTLDAVEASIIAIRLQQ